MFCKPFCLVYMQMSKLVIGSARSGSQIPGSRSLDPAIRLWCLLSLWYSFKWHHLWWDFALMTLCLLLSIDSTNKFTNWLFVYKDFDKKLWFSAVNTSPTCQFKNTLGLSMQQAINQSKQHYKLSNKLLFNYREPGSGSGSEIRI